MYWREKKDLCWNLFGKKERSYIVLIGVALAICDLYVSKKILTFIWSIWLLAYAFLLLEYLQYAHGFICYDNFLVLSYENEIKLQIVFCV